MAGQGYGGRSLLLLAVLCFTACVCEARRGGGGGRGFRGGSRVRYVGSSRRGGQPLTTKGVVWLGVFGVLAVAVIVGILARVYCCSKCKCKKKTPGSSRYAARPVPTSDVDKRIPTNNRTTTSGSRASGHQQHVSFQKTPATAPPSYESVAGGMTGSNSEAGNMNALPYPASPSEDAVYSSADYSAAMPYPASPSDNSSANPTTGYSTALPYSANPSDNSSANPTTGYTTALPYPASPSNNSSANPTAGYSTASSYSANPTAGYYSGLAYSANASDNS